MQFSVYLFDFDGTLFDTRESLVPVFAAGFAVAGRAVTPEECERWMHLNLLQSMADAGIPEEKFDEVIEATIAALDLPESIALIRPFEETKEVLLTLKEQGKKIGIVSNNSSSHIRLVLKTLGFDMPFDCIVGSDMCSVGKPSAEPINLALSLLGEQNRQDVVYVGDSLQDGECGHNAEIQSILVDREDAHVDAPYRCICDLRELFAI